MHGIQIAERAGDKPHLVFSLHSSSLTSYHITPCRRSPQSRGRPAKVLSPSVRVMSSRRTRSRSTPTATNMGGTPPPPKRSSFAINAVPSRESPPVLRESLGEKSWIF